jgi:hypothetical protein
MIMRRSLIGTAIALVAKGIFGRSTLEKTTGQPEVVDSNLFIEAGTWLNRQNALLMRQFALGEERKFLVNQDKQLLRLSHDDGATVDLKIQILGSFNPHKGDFLWAWANDSAAPPLKNAAITAKDFGQQHKIDYLTQAKLRLPFEQLIPVVALSAQVSNAVGVYRCINEDFVSIFVAIAEFDSDALPADFWGHGDSSPSLEMDAIKLLNDWDAENLPIDVEYNRRTEAVGQKDADWDDLIDKKMAIYNRYWQRDDDEWEPSSFGWPSDHDPKEQLARIAGPRRRGGVYVITLSDHSSDAHIVEKKKNKLSITDCDLEWGAGVVFARTK